MKYIKRFEELNSDAYIRAGLRLKDKGKIKRSDKLLDYGYEKHGYYNMYSISGYNAVLDTTQFSYPTCTFNFGELPVNVQHAEFKIIKDEEELVEKWKNGEAKLAFVFTFYFQPKNRTGKNIALFSFILYLSDYLKDTDADVSKNNNLYEDTKINKILIVRPKVHGASRGIFADRRSAFKFKKILPSLIDPYIEKIMDVLEIVGGTAKDIEDIKNHFNSISVNDLYDDERNEKYWFDKEI